MTAPPKKCPRCGKDPIPGISNKKGVCPECWCTWCKRNAAPPPRPPWVDHNGYIGDNANGKPMYDNTIYEPVPGCGNLTGLCIECLRLTCPDCGQRFRKKAGHCRGGRWGGCCRSFANKATEHDPHRITDTDGTRRCKTDAELYADGWQLGGHLWVSPKGVQGRARMAHGMDRGYDRATERGGVAQ